MQFQKAVAQTIHDLRKKAEVSQHELAAAAHLNKNVVGMIERAEQEPSLHTIFLIAQGLGITPAELVQAIDDHHPTLRHKSH